MIDEPTVLIVVPCLNEEANLPRILEQFRREAPGATVVVADGGSVDASREIVAGSGDLPNSVILLDNPRRIQSSGVNLAVERFAQGHDWLLRVDAHCHYPQNYLATLLDAAERSGADTVVVPMVTRGASCFQRAAAAAQNSVLGTGGAAHRHSGQGGFIDHGHHALFRMSTFRDLKGYDESFSHNEDAEFDCRLRTAGGRIWLEPSAAPTYLPRSSPGALFRQYLRYGRGRARTVRKHKLRLKLRQALPLFVAPAMLLAGIGVIGASTSAPAWVVLALPAGVWVGASLMFGALLGIRGRSTCVGAAGAAAAIMHASWSIGFWQEIVFGRRPRLNHDSVRV